MSSFQYLLLSINCASHLGSSENKKVNKPNSCKLGRSTGSKGSTQEVTSRILGGEERFPRKERLSRDLKKEEVL